MMYVKLICGEPFNFGSPSFKRGIETGAALAVGALVIGAIGTAVASNNANITNQEIAEKTNQQNWKMLEEQERYNSPVNQRAMFEQAGYSPTAMLGNASSVGLASASQAAPAQSIFHQGSFDQMAQMLFNYENLKSDTAEKRANVAKTDAESFNLNQQNIYAQQNYMIDTLRNIQSLKAQGLDNVAKGLENDLNSKAFQFKLDNYLLQNQMLQAGINKQVADTNLVNINAMCAEENFKWIAPLNNAELQNRLAHLGTEFALRNKYDKEAELAVQNVFESAARTTGQHISNAQASEAAQYFVGKMKSERDKAGWDAVSAAHSAYNSFNADNKNMFNLYQRGGKDIPTEFGSYAGRLLKRLNPFQFGK